MVLLSLSIVLAETYDGEDAGYGGFSAPPSDSTDTTTGAGGDEYTWGGQPGGTGDLNAADVASFGSQLLDLRLWVYCWHPERDGGVNGDGTAQFVVGDSARTYGYIRKDSDAMSALFPDDREGPDRFPQVSASWLDGTNPKNFRYEGAPGTLYPFVQYGCIPAVGSYHILNVFQSADTGTQGLGFAIDYNSLDGFFAQKIDVTLPDGASAYKPAQLISKFPLYGENGAFSRNIIWDDNQQQCNVIGGNWLSKQGYGHTQCCGDDAIWHKNTPINFAVNKQRPISDGVDETKVHEFCLHGRDQEGNKIPIIFTSSSYGQVGPYTCGETGFYPYDPKLLIDDQYDESATDEVERRYAPFLFDEGGLTETDLGKWSDVAGNNPYVCTYHFDENAGDVYQWKTLAEGADMDQERCEKLGGAWTGSKCCGTKYDYDEQKYLDESFHDPTGEEYERKTCIASDALSNGQTKDVTGSDEITYNLLSSNGSVYGCMVPQINTVGTEYYSQTGLLQNTNIPACGIVKGGLSPTFVCDAATKKFWSVTDPYVKTTLGAGNSLLVTDLPDQLPVSSPPWDTSAGQGCCFNNGCWDGDSCVNEFTSHITADANGNEIHYTCYQGTWGNPLEEDFDWFYNTDIQENSRAFCVQSLSCSCSTNPTDATYCGVVGDAVAANGCTLQQNFFTGDHLCESPLTASLNSHWTSRTKLLAIQLLQFAQVSALGTRYTLFCDDAGHALNNPNSVLPFADDVNNFCVLRYTSSTGEHVVVGTTFNGDEDNPMNIPLQDRLFGAQDFVGTVFKADLDEQDCQNALSSSSSAAFGVFTPCIGNKLWINPQLGAVLYSAETLTAMPGLDAASGNLFLNSYYAQLTTYIAAHEDALTPEHILGVDVFNHMGTFNRIYLAATPQQTIFGFEEEKYDGDVAHANRMYTAVVYDGVTLDCPEVYEAYALQVLGAQVFCGSDASSSQSFILEKSSSGSLYWGDLTAKLRW